LPEKLSTLLCIVVTGIPEGIKNL